MSTPSNEAPVIRQMRQRIERWQADADPRAVFLHCYMLMTANMLDAIDAGEFEDSEWVSRLLHRFADYYFEALDHYEKDPAAAPAVWKLAHDATINRRCFALQRLFLGVNAHINYDLVLALNDLLAPEWAQANETVRQARYRDHCLVNEVIAATIDDVQDDVIEQVEPRMDLVDKMLVPLDEWLTALIIRRWRDDVWRNAMDYVETTQPDARDQLRQHIEDLTLRRARAILRGAKRDSGV